MLLHPRARARLRKVVAAALYYSGFLWLFAAFKLHRRVVVLTYHRVLPAGSDTFSEDAICVTPETFSRHLHFLRRHFHPLSAQQLADSLHSGSRLPARGCVITFDDGWLDNVTYALPLLRQHNMPAVVFLATDYIGSRSCFWQERLARRMFLAGDCAAPAREMAEALCVADVHLLSIPQRRRLARNAINKMKLWPIEKVSQFERALELALSESSVSVRANGDDQFMSWADVASLSPPSLLTAGAHGCSHTPLTALGDNDVERELTESRRRLEAAVGEPILALAYPNGDYDEDVVTLTRRAGYRIAFTTRRGLVSEGDNPLKLRRLNVHEGSAPSLAEFFCLILGVFHEWPREV